MLPCGCFIGALEWFAYELSDIVPLFRELLTIPRNIFPLPRTDPMLKISQEFHF
jgi:hypothetical protein